MSKTVCVMRWIAVVPGALFFAILTMFPIHWAVMLIQLLGRDSDATITINGKSLLASIPPEVLERFGYAFFTPLVWISTAAWISPRLKFQTGIAFAVLWGILFGGALAPVVLDYHLSGWQWLHLAITCLLGGTGVLCGLLRAHRVQTKEAVTDAVEVLTWQG